MMLNMLRRGRGSFRIESGLRAMIECCTPLETEGGPMYWRPVIGWALLWIAIATPAVAQITAFWQQVTISPQAIADDAALANMQCWDLMTTTTGDWASAAMRASLPLGLTFYKHPLGGLTRPDPAIFSSSPALEFTTYASSPSDNGTNNTTFVAGGHPQSQPASIGDATAPTPGIFSMVWADFVVDLPGTYQIARITFLQGAIVDVLNNTPTPVADPSLTAQVSPDSTTIIPDIPEPRAIGLLSAAVLLAIGTRPARMALRLNTGEREACHWRFRTKPLNCVGNASKTNGVPHGALCFFITGGSASAQPCGCQSPTELPLAEPLELRRLLSFAVSFSEVRRLPSEPT
jgi:hypothetical protein